MVYNRDFHIYLNSLRNHFLANDEKEWTLYYFAKLQSPFHGQIFKTSPSLHGHTKDMVEMADRFWESDQGHKK